MKIEVASIEGDPQKVKGDLFEKLAKDLLEAQGYDVIEEIRFVGVELDLLCRHRVNNKQIYVECKAHKEKVSATILRQLLGTVTGYDYSEGWLISTSDFGKEAKGFVEMWKEKPRDVASKLSFYTPAEVISSLKAASIICHPPIIAAEEKIGGKEFLGEWSLLVSSFGRFWAVYTLRGGAPHGVLLFNAVNGRHINDQDTLNNLGSLDCSLAEYDLSVGLEKSVASVLSKTTKLPNVVEVQIGDSWEDYRPARPKDFVGRESAQKEIINFLDNIKSNKSNTRIFAITGNSGLGKSSLIAKIRQKTSNQFYKNRYYTFAVDIRGAKTPSYISASLLTCLKLAQKEGFGDPIELQLTDPSSPLSSPSILNYLESLEKLDQVICLIFDQFEELYSKPELFSIFSAAKDLMVDVAAQKSNFALGFAWKTDSTTQQDHPAYHMWHELSDYRKVYRLDVFDSGEIAKSITTFEKEVDYKLPVELRHQITQSCQGFPWLLKKLCINLHESNKKGDESQSVLADLDVRRLFESDLEILTQQELTCLRIVAQKAPADWSEIIEISGISVVNSLVNKRLIIKSGDRLNVYWDIFKDYLMTGNVPVVPFNYIPTSDLSSMLRVYTYLLANDFSESKELADKTDLQEKTVWNIGADLVMFGLAERKGVKFKHHRDIATHDEGTMLQVLREKIAKHSLKISLYKNRSGQSVSQSFIIETLKSCLPKATYSDKTWSIYSNRLIKILMSVGYLVNVGEKFVVQDTGSPIMDRTKIGNRGKQKGFVFSATASPASVCDALEIITYTDCLNDLVVSGYRNSLTVLRRFDLISIVDDVVTLNRAAVDKFGGFEEAVWTSAKNEPVIAVCISYIQDNPSISASALGEAVSSKYEMRWTPGSLQRNGNSLRQWALWVNEGINTSSIPTPPGRKK
ncbi:restriction endonuclease [Vibrio cholerae]|uniref:restriction endonuclease n=1 Tax=Vibrio cholerae TaxID=666 RepID=UPI000851928E|nr:restriction endonuclease [Vibrio cholerae]EJL6475494.1 restriction endonuclease [Vibrio cholerae]EJL6616506.1 restriction endonuclease [Vibrio cholerae]EJL6651698.1 restriction endonuclease [Vibrio cholerae]EKF9442886.1 restriction endonuclease [Vibrio cholerae]EKF9703404.1 restriction endonuclease [Vibrio cholerae]